MTALPGRRRLGVYVDCPFEASSEAVRVHQDAFGFLTFASEVARCSDAHLTLLGRAAASSCSREELVHLDGAARLVTLPTYENARRLGEMARCGFATGRAMWRALNDLDVVWVFGPHPFALILAALTIVRRKRLVLGVRQDTMAYFAARLPSRRWRPLLALVWIMDLTFRFVSRYNDTTVVGRSIREAYGGDRPGLLDMTVTLVRRGDVRNVRSAPIGSTAHLLTVGRLAPEKNPLLLIDALAELDRREPGRFHLTWVGDGPMMAEVEKYVADLGVGHLVELTGFVPFGPGLLAYYGSSDVFVHTSLTEGSPQVLVEAAGAALPIVATDVGGVGAAVGQAALLVAPNDVSALVDATARVAVDDNLRRQLSAAARQVALAATIEHEARRVADFVVGVPTPPAGDRTP